MSIKKILSIGRVILVLGVGVFMYFMFKDQFVTAIAENRAANLTAQPIQLHENDYFSKETALYEIIDAEITADVLTLIVNYTGGCATHEFSLHTTKKNLKNLEWMFFLEHNDSRDTCTEIKTKALHFDLKTINLTGSESVLLKINNYDKSIKYSY